MVQIVVAKNSADKDVDDGSRSMPQVMRSNHQHPTPPTIDAEFVYVLSAHVIWALPVPVIFIPDVTVQPAIAFATVAFNSISQPVRGNIPTLLMHCFACPTRIRTGNCDTQCMQRGGMNTRGCTQHGDVFTLLSVLNMRLI